MNNLKIRIALFLIRLLMPKGYHLRKTWYKPLVVEVDFVRSPVRIRNNTEDNIYIYDKSNDFTPEEIRGNQ